MNIPLIAANVLTLIAFILHTFIGDKEIRSIAPAYQDDDNTPTERWTMSRCGWHWISFDLLFATIGLALINFSEILPAEDILLQLGCIYFMGYAFVWFLIISISASFPKNYLRLGQWILLALISGCIYWGTY
ncbi:hypothetical protein HN014_12575 [Aquimarina sp. TRL1]|uniref:hypothetical protein n=1 Tax=Aquimarina sp. (strain TRL1) TaxID=2736252 RepID=UPI00158AC3A6|nr:hypothetical protein [Aquimarina sp. TRL1]QKX05708.1 hypothetical protein HN014_12575 [Aquimarina sp. TRL1]